MTDYEKDKLQKFLGTTSKYTAHYLSLVSGDDIENFEFNIGLDTGTVHKLAEFLTRGLSDVVVEESTSTELKSNKPPSKEEPHPMIPPNQFLKALKEMRDSEWVLLADKDGNIVDMSTGIIICKNERSIENYDTIEELFAQYKVISANEAIALLYNQPVIGRIDEVSSLKEKVRNLESYIVRKCMEEQ